MTDGQASTTPSTSSPDSGSGVAGGSSSSNNASSNGSSGEKVNIKVSSTGGGFSFDEFQRATGQETDNVDEPDEPEPEEGSGELLDDPKEATTEPRVKDEPSEDDEGEDDEEADDEAEETDDDKDPEEKEADLEEIGKGVKKGGIKAITKDGKAITLPPDLEIEQTIDGETRKINLREHLNVVAGELTVETRLGKISSFRETVEKRRQELEGFHEKFQGSLAKMAEFAKRGRPDYAICFLAEMNGISPIRMRQQFLKTIVAEAEKFEGKSELEIQNYYLNLENEWRDKKDTQKREKEEKQTKADSFVNFVTDELQKERISPDEFTASSQALTNSGELRGLSQEKALDRVIEHALLTKHNSMAKDAIALVDPKLVNNKKLFELLLEHTHPNKYTVEEMADVVAEYLGKARTRIASSLSRKVPHQQVQARSEKQNEAGKKKVYRSQADLQRAFGL